MFEMADKQVLNALDQLISNAYEAIGKKLTTKDRKKLKKSTFCGPNRSFPVPDCQHVATAKAYLNRSNFSKATKQKIAACINRKAKQLGCSKGKPAKAKGAVDELFDAPIFEETKKLVEQSLENPGMDLEWDDKESNCGE
jgi:hypothetical protein